ncbi:MAG: Ribosomal RNA large subunit methyltransferase L [Nitrospira sp.]|nr:MAG: Ribosomal RNA large subunit methyltransferase L [Nitrospira sp.]
MITMDNTNYRCFAPCPRGLEALLLQELAALGATDLRQTEGGVGFSGPLAAIYRANLESRIASRILLEVAQVPYRNEQDIYLAASAVSWPRWFTPARTIKVKTSAQHCPLKSLDFVTLRIKDAVCDTFTRLKGTRPSVNSSRPDVRIDAFLDATHLTLYLGTTGDSLFKRGFRQSTVEAPLRENLAAGIVQLTGWNKATPLLDPLCGGGTLPLEAAMIARNIAPGLGRRFAFELFANFDPALWKTVQTQAQAKQLPASPASIYASDRDTQAVRTANDQFLRAGVASDIALTQTDLFDLTPPQEPGVIVMNPPYGVRLGTQGDLDVFYPKLGSWLKTRCVGWRVYLFTGDLRAPKLIGLAPTKRTPLFNGAIECRLYEFLIVQGGARRRLTPPAQV